MSWSNDIVLNNLGVTGFEVSPNYILGTNPSG